MTGSISIVLSRMAVAGEAPISSYQFKEPWFKEIQ